MKRILLLLFLLAPCAHASQTWFIRTDGGTATQCTGLVNAAYPGSGTAQPCAVNHPFWLLNQSTWAWNIAGGDTIQFEDQGPYYMGQAFGGLGTTWTYCNGVGGGNCFNPPPPNGTALNPTRILGKNAGSCGPGLYTQTIGINAIYGVWNVLGVQHLDFECIEMTQPDTCTSLQPGITNVTSSAAASGTATYGWSLGSGSGYAINPPKPGMVLNISGLTGNPSLNQTGVTVLLVTGTTSGTFTTSAPAGTLGTQTETGQEVIGSTCTANVNNYASNGMLFAPFSNVGPQDSTFKDLWIHKIASSCILGSHFNPTNSSGVVNLTNILMQGCAGAGFNSDGGYGGTANESQGTINISHMESDWEGCVWVSPGVYTLCSDQQYNGNGDAIVMVAAGQSTWNWSDIYMSYSMQDCFDSLHTGDDPANLPTITATRIWAVGCEGAAIKMGGGNITLTNAVGISNCQSMMTSSNYPSNLPNWNVYIGQPCRANDSMIFNLNDGHTVTLQYITNIGEQAVGWDFQPGLNGCDNSTCNIVFENNATMGFPTGGTGPYNMAGVFEGTFPADPFSYAGSKFNHNAWWNVKNGCPNYAPYDLNYVCGDPKFTAYASVNAIDPHITTGSALIASGVAIAGITADYAGTSRPNPPAIGAFELGGAPPANPGVVFGGHLTVSGKAVIQ